MRFLSDELKSEYIFKKRLHYGVKIDSLESSLEYSLELSWIYPNKTSRDRDQNLGNSLWRVHVGR